MALRRISYYGLETEMLTLDSEGKLVEGGPSVIKAAKESRISKFVEKELSRAQVELLAKEKRGVREVASEYLDNLLELSDIAMKEGFHLLPLGAHPGRVVPKLERNDWYDSLRTVLEEDVFIEGRICGFHFHYTLPEGIVHRDTQQIKTVRRSRAREIFLHQYNFLLAADPAILTFCQSSPFWMGYHWGKDCRVLLYRDMRVDKGE
ncbi:MAG: glutamate-cysteine ligase family protein, partial [Candidatus Micrarchaeota archaeon]